MNIRDYTVQPMSERLNEYVGRVVRHDERYFLVMDCAGQYGWVSLETGQAHLTTSVSDLLTMLDRSHLLPIATLMIGDPQ